MSTDTLQQLATFYVGNELFGIEVVKVQEVTGHLKIVNVPLAPKFLKGLVNFRGQIATAIGMHELLGLSNEKKSGDEMSVVCKLDGNLVSLIVDSIGDVVEVSAGDFENAPNTIPPQIHRYVKGIYKMNGILLSVINLDTLAKELSPANESINSKI